VSTKRGQDQHESKAGYAHSGTSSAPAPGVSADRGLIDYPIVAGRQILHCTFGSTLTNPALAAAIRKVVEANAASYTEILADDFARHLEALSRGM